MKAVSAIDMSTSRRKLLNEIAASQEPFFWGGKARRRESIAEGTREILGDCTSELYW